MGDTKLNPYIFFTGNCREAMEFYKSVFGGELTMQTMAETPADVQEQAGVTEDNKNQIMHARLESGEITIMGSDSTKASDKAAKIELSLTGSDEAKLKEIFNALSEGGEIKMPLEKQFWGDIFGMVSDKYKVDWMLNITEQR